MHLEIGKRQGAPGEVLLLRVSDCHSIRIAGAKGSIGPTERVELAYLDRVARQHKVKPADIRRDIERAVCRAKKDGSVTLEEAESFLAEVFP